MKNVLLTCAVLALFSAPASAIIIGVEQFDYPEGVIAGKNSGTFWNWRNRTPAARTAGTSDWDNVHNTPAVVSGRLVTGGAGQNAVIREYNGPGEGSGADIDRDDGLGAINNFNGAITFQEKKVYYRVTVRTGATLPDYFGLSSHDFSTEKLFFGKRGGSSTFGLESVGVGGTNGTRTIDPNTTYTLVVRIDYLAGTIALFVDPALNADETSQLSISRTFDTTFWSTAVRLSAGGGGDPVQWDDLVVATTWEDLGSVVTTTADEDDGSLNPASGTGISLREAVKYSPTGSLITFDSSLSGKTITLTHADGDMEIPGVLTIDASALPGGVTVSGNNTSRHFFVGSGKSLTLRGLTLTGGNGTGTGLNNNFGGAINNAGGALTLTQCTLSNNSALASGGAIFNQGTMALSHCTLSDNSALTSGGAILNQGTMTLSHCTLSSNFTTAAHGGAIRSLNTMTLTQCTLSGNFTALNGGAIYTSGFLELTNSIVAGNSLTGAGSGADIYNTNTVTLAGANLVQSLVSNGGTVTGSALTGGPKLSPLGYFGGPVQTMHPLIGSPAIDAAGDIDPGGTDARGFPRFVDGDASGFEQLDIGAVEAGPITIVDNVADTVASATLRTRINNAAGIPGARIGFLVGSLGSPATITLGGTQLDIPATPGLFIDASNYPGGVTISGGGNSRVFHIPATSTVAMRSLRIVNGFGSFENGGGILNSGTCTVLSSTLSENSADGSGGGIYNTGTCTVLSSTLSGNSAGNNGGGIYSSGTCTVLSSTLSGNSANFGGGIHNTDDGICTVLSSTLSENSASSGGGINTIGTCTVRSSTLSSNSANGTGGGIRILGDDSFTVLFSSIVAGNTALNNPEITGSLNSNTSNLIGGAALPAPLADNGGPTQTMRLLPGSPARNDGAASARSTDQRGFPIVGTPDIGAYEAQIGPIADVAMIENTAPPTRNFSVGQIGTLTVASSNTALVPLANISLSGTGASRSITATPAANQLGSSTITLTDSLTGETQTYTVTVTLDPAFVVTTIDPSGPGSLTQALINAANAAGPNTITFASGFPNIMFPAGEFFITDNDPVAIDATSVSGGLTLSAPIGSRHFQVPVGKTLTLRGLILENGDAGGDGGSIYNEGTLHLERCALRYNDSPFSGGAVACVGAASVFTATGCSFSENNANGNGGAINCVSGTVTLTQCTLAMNSAPASLSAGGLQMNGGSLNLIHCTLSTNSGGLTGGLYLESVPVANITHSIIAGNTKTNTTPADIFANASPIIPSGANLIGNNEGAESVFPAGPLVGTAAAPLNPDLSALGNYGGPTATMPPNVNSPAIDQASVLSPALTTDQRGEPRPMGVRPDLGAVESSVIIVTTPVDELDAPGALGNGVSLREAVRDIPAGGTIGFDRAVFNSLATNTITLTKGPLNPQRNCTLSGALNPGGINVLHTPTITAQPLPLSLASGATANFTLSVTNLSGGLAYEWRKNGTPNDITTPALALVNVQEADEAVYDVNIIEAVAPGTLTQNDVILNVFATTSQPAALIVDGSNVTIQRHPSSAMLALGSVHTLSVVAIGPAAPALTYQWFKAGRAIPGATKSSYVIAKAALSHAGAYTCVVKSGTTSPGVTSTTAEIGVVDTSLRTMSLKEGSKFTTTVVAAGNGLSYDWNKNGLGDTTKTLTINSVSMDDADLVQCIVSLPSAFGMKGGRVRLFVSNAAPALVTPLAPPTAYIGQNYFYQLPVVNTAGAPTVSFSLTGALPSGLTFNKTTGILSGRPTVTKSAGYPLSFKAINASGSSAPATATLKVNVVPPNAVGVFAGPLERSPLNDNLGGRFDLTTTATGLCSGSVTLGARAKLSFTNQLLLSSGVSDAILRVNIPGLTMADKTPLTAYLEVFAVEQIARLTLLHPNGTTLLATAWRNSWSKTRPATAYAATYTARLDPANVGNPPRGYGFATLLVKPDGTLTLTGKLPDGSGLTQAGFVGPEGQLTLFNLLHTKRGSLVGSMQLIPGTPVANNTLGGTLDWFKPGPFPKSTDTVYQAGFGPLAVTVEGSPYIAPAKGQRVLGLGTTPNPNAKLDFTLGGLAPEFAQPLYISNASATGLTNKGTLTLPLTNSTKLTTLDAAKGLFTGSFIINGPTTALNRPAPFEGMIVKIGATTQGYGFFLLPTATAKISTSPKISGRVVLGVP